MKILVIGREGQLARSLAEASQRSGSAMAFAGRSEFSISEMPSVARLLSARDPAIVINTAAYTQVDQAELHQADARRINADGAEHIAQACAERGIPIVHISTDYVFDGRKSVPYKEVDVSAPLNSYGRTKHEGELRVAAANAKHLILRTSWVHSPWGRNFVRTMLDLASTRPVISVVSDQHGSPTFAPHLAEAILALAQHVLSGDDPPWGVYHAAGHDATTWCGFAREIFRQANRHGLPTASVAPIATEDYPTVAKRPHNSRLDCTALASAFAVALPNWQTGVQECVARIAANRSGHLDRSSLE